MHPSDICIDGSKKLVAPYVVGLAMNDDVQLMQTPGRKKKQD